MINWFDRLRMIYEKYSSTFNEVIKIEAVIALEALLILCIDAMQNVVALAGDKVF